MELKLKNGERILMACIQQKNEGEGNAAGKKMSVKLLYTTYNKETGREELVTEWISFWNGNKPTEQLYTRISEIPVGEWIVVKIAQQVGKYDAAALDFIHGEGILTAAERTNGEVNIIVGKASLKHCRKNVVNDKNVYEVILPLVKDSKKYWYKISFWGNKNPNLPDIVEKLVSKDVDVVYVCGKLAPYDNSDTAFTATGFKAEMLKVNKASSERLPETPVAGKETKTNSMDDIQITIGIHAHDKPKLSELTNDYDIGWMRSVITYYKPANEAEKEQIKAMEMFLEKISLAKVS